MDVKELRIGNWVNLADKGDYQIDNGHEIDTIADWFDLDKNELDEDQYATPIVLTEKWLINFGFTQQGTIFNKLHKNGLIAISIRDKSVGCYNCKDNYMRGSGLNMGTVRVKYVHQLQNLYYPITGEELELTENTATVG